MAPRDERGEVGPAERRAGSSARSLARSPSAARRRAAGSRRAPRPAPASRPRPRDRRAAAARPTTRPSTISSIASASSPSRHRTSPAGSSRRRRIARELLQLRLAGCPSRSGTVARKATACRRCAPRQTSRSSVSKSSPPAVSAAVIIEYSGTSSHVEVSTVSGSEAISSERGVSLGGHRRLAVAHRRTRRRACTRGSRTAGPSRAARPRPGTSRSRTRTAWRRAPGRW